MSLLRRAPRRHSRHAGPPVALGVAGAVVLLLGSYLIFTKRLPFVHGHRIGAVVQTASGLRDGTPVRIAGVHVGEVTGVRKGPGAASTLELELDDGGLPVHRDATIRVRPRLFLEGGYYLELSPGSPGAQELEDGDTIPLPQTAVPVQTDQVLGTLDRSARSSLEGAIAELDDALAGGGAQDLAGTGAPLADALRDGAIVTEAARGTEAGDATRLVRGAARTARALASRREELASLVQGLARTTNALAAEDDGLRGTVRELAATMRAAPADLRRVEAALPDADATLAALRPGLRRAPGVLPDTAALLEQLRAASGPRELAGLLDDLRAPVRRLPGLADQLRELFPLVTPVTRCVETRLLPVLEAELQDGRLTTGDPVWQDIAHILPGMAASSAGFDANGFWVRNTLSTDGENLVSTGKVPGLGTLAGRVEDPILGVRPQWLGPGRLPPYREDQPCADQRAPDLQARTDGGAPMRTLRSPKRASSRMSRGELRRLLRPATLRRLLPRPAGSGR
ncbi:MlaD family protein [Conexibacter sp. SYSU D00693]|uniref:MlaD family protein n=1 Tax=Conexibacter sp. SYSU D00693 TaxID=2812560 RepID=UPI00196A214A|nr:MlaD family protein [Conexibacter sp. SYSU D00693]